MSTEGQLNLRTDGDPNRRLLEVPMPKKFTRQVIARMTENVDAVIGEGGYGKVYLGKLDNGVQVAVKTLKGDKLSKSGVKGFQAEVNAITKVHHKNLVKLIGYCDDDIKHVALVYEYMEGGSLHDHLSDEGKRSQLSWRKRLQIASEVAEGLQYLHKGCQPPIIHRDIKPGNILLTKKLEARIGDFGLSKMFEGDRTHMSGMGAAGTQGYCDPEYVRTYQLRDKSDVYSFGVVLMQLITGSRVFDHDRNIRIADWARGKLSTNQLEEIIDKNIKEEYGEKSVLGFAKIAEKCTRMDHQQRPDITEVVEEIKKLCTAYDNPEEQQQAHVVGSRGGEGDGEDVVGSSKQIHSYSKKMTEKQFMEWLKDVDANKDGRISKKELRDALRALGLHFTGWKVWRAMVHADLDGNLYIEGEELKELTDYARKRWGIIVD